MSHFDAIRWSDCLLPALGGLRLQDSHARNIALGTSAAAYAQPDVTGGEGTLAVSDGKLCLHLPRCRKVTFGSSRNEQSMSAAESLR